MPSRPPRDETGRFLGPRIGRAPRPLSKREQELEAIRNSPCAVCGAPPPSCVDHDHTTGRIRGPLCDGCNKALGFLRDDPRLALRLAAYVSGTL